MAEWRHLSDPDLALTWLQVLDDESRALTGSQEESPARDLYERRRRECAARAADPDTDEALQEARQAYRKELIARLHEERRSALCFSGGGIRSATFGLGVLQGLAAYSRRDGAAGSRPGLVGEFDYLSTVSGGGYLGAWFSSWAARLSKDGADGPALAMRALAAVPEADFDPEPSQVRHLRKYSNYLMPKLGLFSGDTLAAVASVFRNIFLNWLVLIPVLAAVLLLPELARSVVMAWDVRPATEWFLLLTGMLLGVIATGYVGFDLPSVGNAGRRYTHFLWLSLVPMILAAVQLSTFWAWLSPGAAGQGDVPAWDLVSLGKSGITLLHFGSLGALMHGGGMLCGVVAARIRLHRPSVVIGIAAVAVAAITGFVGGIVGWLVSRGTAAAPIQNHTLFTILGFPALLGMFILTSVLLVGASSYFTLDRDREWWARSGGWLMLVALAWPVLASIVLFAPSVLEWLQLQIASLAAGTGLAGWGAAKLGQDADTPSGRRDAGSSCETRRTTSMSLVKDFAARLLMPVFLVLLVMLVATANHALLNAINRMPDLVPSLWPAALAPAGNATAHVWWAALLYGVVLWISSSVINVNKFSLHAMYRQRLIRAYLGASNMERKPHPFTGFDDDDNVRMMGLSANKPMHVVNMSLNLLAGENLAWQQRKAESFTSTRLHTGGCRVGYRPSSEYGGRYKSSRQPISLGTAMTISGAAASPNMGYQSSPLLTIVMTLFNARLGWWLGNPRDRSDAWKRSGPWGIRPFLDEAFGYTNDENKWVYLSDGGHFENLAIYEMVLRRCAVIVVSDAGCDPAFAYEDLGNAIRKIRVDLGIPIEFTGRMPMWRYGAPVEGLAGVHCAVGAIRYDAVDGPDAEPGVLVYIKPALNGNEPADIAHYASTDHSFPHQSTADQFFDEAQFESYRRLGVHIVEEICGDSDRSKVGTFTLAEFVSAARQYSAAGARSRHAVAQTEGYRGL